MALLTLDDGVVVIGSQVSQDPTPIAGYELATGRQAWALGLDAGSWQLTARRPAWSPFRITRWTKVASTSSSRPQATSPGGPASVTQPSWQALPLSSGPISRWSCNCPRTVRRSRPCGNLTTGSLIARHRLGSSQVPLTLAALGPDLYGTGLGPDGKTESGFVERIGLDGVIWRLILPQPAQTSPVALPEGGIAIQTEDLQCATALA